MDRKLSSASPLAYQGVRPSTPPNLVLIKRAPTITDYKEWCLGDLWLNSSNLSLKIPPKAHDLWMITSMQENIANWVHFGSGDLTYLTPDTGGQVGPDDSFNMNLLGTINQITTTGTPASNTITLSLGAGVPLTFTEDSGIAAAQFNNLNIFGTAGEIVTSGVGSTVTIGTGSSVATSYVTNSGTASPALGVLNVLGLEGILTSGIGNTITIETTPTTKPSFQAYISGNGPTNVTGDGTVYQILFDSTTIDVPNSNFNTTTGEYTIPTDGLYYFSFNCGYRSEVGGGEQFSIKIRKFSPPGPLTVVVAQAGGMPTKNRVANFYGPNNTIDSFLAGIVECKAGDIISCEALGTLGAKLDGIQGSNANPGIATAFCGFLIS